jgi:hypothetical protein
LEITGPAADLNEKLLDALDVLAASGYVPSKILNDPPANVTEIAQGKPSLIPMAHENNKVVTCELCGQIHDASMAYGGTTIIGCPEVPEGMLIPSNTDWAKMLKAARAERARSLGYPVDPNTGFATSGMGADYHLVAEELRETSVWICTNHPPGSEIEVKKGEACYCGNKEAN